jgi:ATP adenylyltransferase
MAGADARRLWAPWRMAFIRRAARARGCLFCRLARSGDDRARLVVLRRGSAYLMLNRYPYNPGHLMVAVRRHAGSLAALRDAERRDLLELAALAERALEREYAPHGMNVGANLGKVAGAGYAGHLHWHIVPRWQGDTNFMPTVGGVKVLPETLARTWRRMRGALAALARARGAVTGGGRRGPRRPGTARRATRRSRRGRR